MDIDANKWDTNSRTLTSAWIETVPPRFQGILCTVALSRVRGLKPVPRVGWPQTARSHSHECVDLDVVD